MATTATVHPTNLCRECGATMTPSLRYEVGRNEPIPVLCCWECGAEIPPLYQRPVSLRDDPGYRRMAPAVCEECALEFAGHPSSRLRFCSQGCALAAARRRVKHPIWEKYRRPAS